MNFRLLTSQELDDWDVLLHTKTHPHILQTREWGSFKKNNGWHPLYLYESDSKTPILLLKRHVWGLGNIAYIPKGPCLDYTAIADLKVLSSLLSYLKEELVPKEKVFLLKIECEALEQNRGATEKFSRENFFPSDYHPQFKRTMWLDLDRNESELLASFKSKTRYNIRLAKRKGVDIKQAHSAGDLALFYRMYKATGLRGHFPVRPFDYYQKLWINLLQSHMAELFLAYHENEPLAGVLLFRFADRVSYQYGASFTTKQNLMPNYLLQWKSMQWAQAKSARIYDMVGLPEHEDENDPFAGVWRFKKGFCGQEIDFIGAMDYFPSSHKKKYWQALKPYYKRLLWYTKKEVLY